VLDFNRVYLETEPLLAGPWPRVSKALETALRLCQQFGVEIFLPAPVLEQLEAHWRRALNEALKAAAAGRSRVEKLCARVGVTIPPDEVPSSEETLSKYEGAVGDFLSTWSIQQAPVTTRPIAELFTLAVGLRPPFEAEGKNFQDAVILLSAVDHLLANPVGALFLSADGDFRNVSFEDYLGAGKARLRLCPSIADLQGLLEKALDAVVRARWMEDRLLARAALEKELPRLETFLRENLRIEADELGAFVSVAGIPSATVRLVQKVETPFPTARKEGDRVNVTALIEVELKVVRREWPRAPSEVYKIGDSVSPVAVAPFDLASFLPRLVEGSFPLVVEVEAVATFTGGNYSDVQFSSVRVRRGVVSLVSVFDALSVGVEESKEIVKRLDAQNMTPGSIKPDGS